jgi:hypothetical protein
MAAHDRFSFVSTSSPAVTTPSQARTRRPLRARSTGLIATAIGALLLSSCATFTEANQVARVGSIALERSELDALLTDATPGAASGAQITVDMSVAHNILNSWLLTEILRSELTAAGLTVTDQNREDAIAELFEAFGPNWDDTTGAALKALQIEQQAVINGWRTGLADSVSPDQVRAAYEQGHETSMVICASHILTVTLEKALEAQAELAAGRPFEEVAEEYSVDQATAVNGGALPCSNPVQFAQAFVSEFVDAALSAEIGIITEPVPTAFGYHIIRLDPYTEARAPEITMLYTSETMRFQRAARAAQVYVDPRYGTFDPQAGVLAIG